MTLGRDHVSRSLGGRAAMAPTSSTITTPSSGTSVNRTYGTRSDALSAMPSRSTPLPAHGRSWLICWVTPESAATPMIDKPPYTMPRIGIRLRNVTGSSSATHADRRQREQVGDRLGEGEADPRPDAVAAAEQGTGVAVVDEQVDEHAEQHRQHEQQPDRGDQRRPGEERHAAHAHPRGASGQHGRRHRRRRRGEADDEQAEGGDEQVDHVVVAAAGAAVVGERHDHQDEAAEPRPEAGGGQAGEGERPGADLQRHDGDGDDRAAAGRAHRRRGRCGRRRTSAAARRRRRGCRRRRSARRRGARRERRRRRGRAASSR